MKKLVLLSLVLPWTIAAPAASDPASDNARRLWDAWPAARQVTTPAPCLTPTELGIALESLAAEHGDILRLEELGRSVQDRPIRLLTIGRGPQKVLLWSQMHGDEPSATPALLDLVNYLAEQPDDPNVSPILDELTLLVVPMLNPDGSAVYRRRNAQGIDMNRDALNLVTPEGRLLKHLRDEHEPILGFNLHDQNRRRTVGDTGVPASNALLAVAGDEANTVTPGRLRAKKACSAIARALAEFRPGGMARYDETFSPRSFGDNITAWGTPVVLIESGSVVAGTPFEELSRLNFVGILTVLEHLAQGTLDGEDPSLYEELPDNELGPWTDVALRGGSILQPGAGEPYRADLTFDLHRSDQSLAGCAPEQDPWSRITEVGDARERVAAVEVDGSGRWIIPVLSAGIRGWKARGWLEADPSSQLVAAGIVELTWQVPNRRIAAARSLVETRGSRLPRVHVTSEPLRGRLQIRSRPPSGSPTGTSLGEALKRVLDGASSEALSPIPARELGAALWSSPWPLLRPDAEASFLILEPGVSPQGVDDLRVEQIWIDGERQLTPETVREAP